MEKTTLTILHSLSNQTIKLFYLGDDGTLKTVDASTSDPNTGAAATVDVAKGAICMFYYHGDFSPSFINQTGCTVTEVRGGTGTMIYAVTPTGDTASFEISID